MTSTFPVQIIDDDDDEFDWEAAVREIDVSCEKAKCSSSSIVHNSPHFALPHHPFLPEVDEAHLSSPCFSNTTNTKPGACKQSTLHKFLARAGPLRPPFDFNQQHTNGIEGDPTVRCAEIDADAAQTWIYPVNIPLRDYQFAITKTALFANTLVALPTGLGKTLIAAVVMYNYFRWFPNGNIVFAAPSRPLVMQQIEACHNIVGIPQEWTIDLTGQVSPARRACFWKTKRVFFVTPQVLEKDIQSGTCLVRNLVCLVIDEAHRALGNYSYCVAVRELMAIPVQLRILALTATPGSKQPAIQHIIDNLHISTLEYRNESDPDVSPYVHNRKIELIEVALGQDAVNINKRLLEVIRPYVTRLSAIGLLQNRDYQTLSPPDLLNSRDNFRRAPPPDLPQSKYGEIEAYFGGLITLYHIRKLLSSHGIRPAYEMLEEKLKQGLFARLMSKNEDIRKVKLLMQQSLSNGAPSPKLAKLLEVLIDHFKTKDPCKSRVIIFSNFRGSVRDIMDALANIGDLVKATEFIGQSSGKALKGQSQKVQQAVLQKFRAGGYNVIVATSIGEEGLDIMEVDLVICFDANVSPLRMVQRMGRTGRKHDGRVVVLACEGSELKGYMRKQANSRAIKKHMRNGGINSFNFHPSPRMIPHIFKPEVKYVALSIEQYIPRGKKVKDDAALRTPVFKEKLTVAESALIAKYFQPTNENNWRPSLIAFPHFQAVPSRVHKVMHSYRTEMLIDTMQHLQGLSFSRGGRVFQVEDEICLVNCSGVSTMEVDCKDKEDLMICDDFPSANMLKEETHSEVLHTNTLSTKKHNLLDLQDQSPPAHSYLFGSDFISLDHLGQVLILSVPLVPLKEASEYMCTRASTMVLPTNVMQKYCHMKTSGEDFTELAMQGKAATDLTSLTQNKKNVVPVYSNMPTEKDVRQDKTISKTPIMKRNLSKGGENCIGEAFDVSAVKVPSPQYDKCTGSYKESELSPRLTNMIQSGIVPESPINDCGLLKCQGRHEFLALDFILSPKFTDLLPKTPSPRRSEASMDNTACQRAVLASPICNQVDTPSPRLKTVSRTGGCTASPVAEESNMSLASFSKERPEDWPISSGDESGKVIRVRKFKMLRKVGDIVKDKIPGSMTENSLAPMSNIDRPFFSSSPDKIMSNKGKRKRVGNVNAFIEEKAEVSSEAEISDDEEDDQDNSSYDDSFIDDETNTTSASTEDEVSKVDMMAVYRRSLLSQSPMPRATSSSATFTPDYGPSTSRIIESGSSLVKTLYSIERPPIGSANQSGGRNSESYQMDPKMMAAEMPSTTDFLRESEMKLEIKKKKSSFCQSGSIPAINLGREFSLQTDAAEKGAVQHGPMNKFDANGDIFYDDQFFASLDLDAVEAEATSHLKPKSELPVHKQDIIPKLHVQNVDFHTSPSFDLGIG